MAAVSRQTLPMYAGKVAVVTGTASAKAVWYQVRLSRVRRRIDAERDHLGA
jgi:hypothetical protein